MPVPQPFYASNDRALINAARSLPLETVARPMPLHLHAPAAVGAWRSYNEACAQRSAFADHPRRKPEQGLCRRRDPGLCRARRVLRSCPGDFVAIVGPSGSGKSTLFYLLGGLTRATHGRVVIDGIDFASLNDAERTRLRKHRIGFVFQKFNLLPTLSAMGNIEIAYDISGRKEPTGPCLSRPLERLTLDSRPTRSPAHRVERRRTAARRHRPRSDYAAGHRAGRRADRQPGHQELRRRTGHAAALQSGVGTDRP